MWYPGEHVTGPHVSRIDGETNGGPYPVTFSLGKKRSRKGPPRAKLVDHPVRVHGTAVDGEHTEK